MGVSFQHSDYTEMLPIWTRCIDAANGQDAIHKGGPIYLPQLTDESDQDYKDRLQRTPFYNASKRTIVGLRGMLFRKEPQVAVPDQIETMLNNITLDGTTFDVFCQETVEVLLTTNRCGVLVDYPNVNNANLTQADAAALQLRPLIKRYSCLSITNWKTINIENQLVLSMVVLKEQVALDDPEDEFETEPQIQYRVLDLIPVNNGYQYRVRIFIVENQGDKEVDILLEESYPICQGKPLDRIPFFFLSCDNMTPTVKLPPLLDLINMNLSHYTSTADYEHGCHFTGLPTPVVTGFNGQDNPNQKFYIGSKSAWLFPSPAAKASYLEFTGQGLQELAKNIAAKESKMAILGARMLEPQSAGVESADTVAIRRVGEQSILSALGYNSSNTFTLIMQSFCSFAGAAITDVTVMLNKDFYPVPLDALTLTALIAGYQNGGYSYKTLFNNLQESGLIANDQNVDQEITDIKGINPSPTIQGIEAAKNPTTVGNQEGTPTGPKMDATPATPAPTITQLQKQPAPSAQSAS